MNQIIKLAQKAVEKYIKQGEKITPSPDLPGRLLKEKSGVFVTIKKGENLKGCIGTYKPTEENIAKEIIENAIVAATKDNRFPSITEKELEQLSYEVSLLSEPKMIKKLEELNPEKYGVIVKNVSSDSQTSTKAGLLLPNLSGIDTKEEQIGMACQKAGIDPQKENIVVYMFTAKKYNE